MNTYFGNYGGQYVPEKVKTALQELEKAYEMARQDENFQNELDHLLKTYVGRETPLYHAKNLSQKYQREIYLKREDLNHTGAHKINNALGQALLAKRMGKKKVMAETGAGQHGVATATAAALLGLECEVYMGAVDVERQSLNVFRMKLLGAKVISVHDGGATLTEATTKAIESWVDEVEDVFYIIGSVVGPAPYPEIVAHFQSIIGKETKSQLNELGKRATDIIACVGGGSNAMGIFADFIDEDVRLYGVEAAGHGVNTSKHAATLTKGKPGIIHGMKTIVLQDENGEVEEAHSISAGLDYPGVGPQHAHFFETKRVDYAAVTDGEAMRAIIELSQLEGIIPALESAHALAYLSKLCPTLPKDAVLVVNVSGRGDKDIHTIFSYIEENNNGSVVFDIE
ncbi:MAG: tryptophan synthase subunit beta [Culicoidibacterales bacterium]